MTFMNKAPLIGGIAFMLGSVLFLVNKINEMSRLWLGQHMPDLIDGNDIAIILIGQVAYVIGYVIYFRHFARRAGKAAQIGIGLFCLGGLMVALAHSIPERIVTFIFAILAIGVLVMVTGLILFGIITLRQHVLTRWQWLPLFTGVTGALGFLIFSGPEINSTFLVFRTLFALGLFAMGLNLALEKSTKAAA
jgi:hypothetical protein